jgi:hypothetical protein
MLTMRTSATPPFAGAVLTLVRSTPLGEFRRQFGDIYPCPGPNLDETGLSQPVEGVSNWRYADSKLRFQLIWRKTLARPIIPTKDSGQQDMVHLLSEGLCF